MEKLKSTIEQHGRWSELKIYIDRIEGNYEVDFSVSVENAKALLETIGKQICAEKNVELTKDASINVVLKRAFCSLGYSNEALVNKISGSLANIAQEIGNLRNEISPTSHGRSLDDLKERNNKVDLLTREFLIDSTLTVAVFLIRALEERNSTAILKANEVTEKPMLKYDELEDFNDFWDGEYGEFPMGDYLYNASEILFYTDYQAYEVEYKAFKDSEQKVETGEEE